MKKPKEFESIRGTIVQWRLFDDWPELIEENDVKINRDLYVDIANVPALLDGLESAILEKFKSSEKISMKPIQEASLNGFFNHLKNIVSNCPSNQELGIDIINLLEFMDTFVGITATGAHDECYRDFIRFFREGLETDNVSKKLEDLLNTHNQMRGKKLTKDRKKIYGYLEKEEKNARLERIPVTFEYLLRKYSKQRKLEWTEREIHRILEAFYQWRLRSIKRRIKKTIIRH